MYGRAMMSARRGLVRGARPAARRIALGCAVAGAGAAFLLFMIEAVGGTSDADRYGRVPLPGRATLELPAGDLALYYEERVTLGENDVLDVPDGLVVKARGERTVRSRRGTPNSISLDGRALREFGKLRIPSAGRYRVNARSDAPGSNSPAVTLGKGQLDNLARSGVHAAIAAAAGLALALAALLIGRRGDEPPPPSSPLPSAAVPRPGTSIRL
jgi:hypothetical protein